MSNFVGIDFDVNGYKAKQIVIEEGEPVEKTSPIAFWVVHDIGGGRYLYTHTSQPVCSRPQQKKQGNSQVKISRKGQKWVKAKESPTAQHNKHTKRKAV